MSTMPDDGKIDRGLCRALYHEFQASLFEEKLSPDYASLRAEYAELLADLACFVEYAAATDERPFVPMINPDGRKGYHCAGIAWQRHFKSIPRFIIVIGMLSPRYSYSEHTDLFTEACVALGLPDSSAITWDNWHLTSPILPNGTDCAEVFNALCATLRRDWTGKGYKTRFQRRQRETVKRTQEYQNYVESWFEKLATLIVLRVDC